MRIGPLGIWELLIILVVVLLIFGPRRLPEMAKGIGQSVREFRKGIRDMKDDFEAGTGKDDKPVSKTETTTETRAATDTKADAKADVKASETTESEPVDNRPVESKLA